MTLFAILMFLILPLITSCAGNETKQQNISAQETANMARSNWKKTRKPFVITLDEPSQMANMGVTAILTDATEDEVQAFDNVRFSRNKMSFISDNRASTTSDSTAKVFTCYPYRQGLKIGNVIRLEAPFTDNLYGKELSRTFGSTTNIKIKMQSSMAMIRVVMESNDVRDMLDELKITGEEIYTSGQYNPYNGEWLSKNAGLSLKSTQAGCLLNNGRKHDIYLIPTEKSGKMTVFAKVNSRNYAVNTMLPHLNAGSMIQLNVRKNNDALSIVSSWVESERVNTSLFVYQVDTVKVGHYLQKEGYISAVRDSNSVAYVFQTDGKHGKAIALNDCKGRFCFSSHGATSHKYFPTVDGKRKEGLINPTHTDGIGNENIIIYKAKIPFTESCALGYSKGDFLTSKLVASQEKAKPSMGLISKTDMLTEVRRHPGSYVPSLSEMVKLYYQLHPVGEKMKLPIGYDIPIGEYITSSEQTDKTTYMIDFTNGIIAGGLSKQYSSQQLRLFYLF